MIFIKTIIRFLLSIILGVVLFAALLFFAAFSLIKPENVVKAVTEADIVCIIDEAISFDTIAEVISALADPSFISFNLIDESFTNLNAEDFYDFFKNKNVRNEIGNVAGLYAVAIKEKNFYYYFAPRDAVNLIRAIESEIREFTGYKLNNEDYKLINEFLSVFADMKKYTVDYLLAEFGINQSVPYAMFTIYPLMISGLICLLIIFNIIILNRRKIRGVLLNVGTPVLLFGLSCLAFNLMIWNFGYLLSQNMLLVFTRLLPWLVNKMLTISFVPIAAGAFLICFYIVANFVIKAPADKTATVQNVVKGKNLILPVVLLVNTTTLVTCAVMIAISFS